MVIMSSPINKNKLIVIEGIGLMQNDKQTKYQKAVEQQRVMASQVQLEPLNKKINLIAGADAAFPSGANLCLAAIVILTYPKLEVIEKVTATVPLDFPYIPGLLSFREAPAILEAYKKLKHKPDIMMLDGQGVAHPRRFGLACHVGVELQLPTIGCAKSRFIGEYVEPDIEKGSTSDLLDGHEVIGQVLRSRHHVKPIFVSAGHLLTLKDATMITKSCCVKYRIPEPTRLADQWVSKCRSHIGED